MAAAALLLPKKACVLVWGLPCGGMIKKTNLADLNSEISFKGGFETQDANTVSLNQSLVHRWAARGMDITGFNPGLIKTHIRNSLHGGSCLGGCLEGIINMFKPSNDQYAARLLHLFVTTELAATKDLLFHQD